MPPRHKFIRLRGYDYAQGGAYFVTINTYGRRHLLGRVVAGTANTDAFVELSDDGLIVQECWDGIPVHFPGVFTDAFQIMPDHLHGIVVIGAAHGPAADNGAARAAVGNGAAGPVWSMRCIDATDPRPRGSKPRSLSAIVGSFKSAATKRINLLRGTPGAPVWQHNYHDRIIRDGGEHERIAQYIHDNPTKWANDPGNR
ncbi:MAG TPA: hypothetical protein PKD45_09310 [Flavobacteriales bacterium]|nr:hypothetical protein [Flavobacteriales bacterium]